MGLHTQKPTLALCGIFIATQTAAFTTNANESIEKITITGSRLSLDIQEVAASLSVITQEEIRLSGATQLSEILRGLPGVAISSSGSLGALNEIRLRGNESNHLLVILDGVIINDDSQGGLIDLAHINIKDVAKIELIRGPQASAWGSGAVGGVLHIQTLAHQADDARLRASVSAGNKDTRQGYANLNGRANAHHYAVSLQHVTTEGDNIARSGNEKDGYRRNTVNAHYRYAINDIKFSTIARLVNFENDYDTVDFMETGLPIDANNYTEGQQATAKVNLTYAPAQSDYATSVSGTYSRHQNDNFELGTFTSSAESERFQFANTHSMQWDKVDVVVGAEYLQRLYTQRGSIGFADPNQKQDDQTASVFVESLARLSDNIDLTVGARFDENSEFDNAFSYRSGISWQHNAHLTTFLSVGKAIKNPTFTERFGYFPGTFLGNQNLQPEHIQEWELGLRARLSPSLQGQVSVYQAELQDEILGFVFDPASGLMTAQNAAFNSDRSGLDSEMSFDWGALTWRATYSYLDASQGADNAEQVELRRPRHSGGISVAGALTEQLSTYVKWTYTGSQQDAYFPPPMFASQSAALRPYSLLSFNINYQLTPAWATSIRVENALNQDYENIVGFAGERRSILLTLTYADSD
ncbi:TonB-dependent receptor plug domain-containing protein [Alteromonas ponticola]|uniref:TonB-dependent receptor n=1 Tax=Alteromonas ponticola TaxID=2720613 RepID=A0ABX1R560_9ALTE|nr:TonB-dependent receptor [Alteromonas ponticola]NMH60385.1 TonB-dependent receptor [Alteromonas ponticola]